MPALGLHKNGSPHKHRWRREAQGTLLLTVELFATIDPVGRGGASLPSFVYLLVISLGPKAQFQSSGSLDGPGITKS